MGKKRLQHIANTLCQIFCGWETFFDYHELVKLGSGTLRINVLTADGYFNNLPIRQLYIAKGLNAWLKEECKTNNIEITFLISVQLSVEMDFSVIGWEEREYSLGEKFFIEDKPYQTDKMHRCYFKCEGIVQTSEKIYKSKHSRIREWPFGWP